MTNHFEVAMAKILDMHRRKKQDYTHSGEFDNFVDSANAAGVSVAQSIEVMIATKESRRQNLENTGKAPVNESVEDTLLDRAVYSIIRYAHYLSEKGEDNGVN